MLRNLGNAYRNLGETRRAIEFYEQALVIDREIGNRLGEGADLNNLGLAYAELGEIHRAIEFHEKALVIDREIGNRQGEANVLMNIGNVRYSLGEFPHRWIGLSQITVLDLWPGAEAPG
jgi:tetratricopeptide (TPR) repeat protein